MEASREKIVFKLLNAHRLRSLKLIQDFEENKDETDAEKKAGDVVS
tara:strand:+ start:201 stop:338 length:138 start_codon:yes stop_codon:yes gene_type:complete